MSHSTVGELVAANIEWAKTMSNTNPNFFLDPPPGQQPPTLWIGCADSRVPESVILNQLPGQIFTQRNIANQVRLDDASMVSTIHFAVRTLGVRNIIVAGHTRCGGVALCAPPNTQGRSLALDPCDESSRDPWANLSWPPPEPLNEWLGPLREWASQVPDPTELGLEEENVRRQVDNVRKILVAPAGRSVSVHGWIYQLENGHVRNLDCCFTVEGSPA